MYVVAPNFTGYSPEGQFCSIHSVTLPPNEYVPIKQYSQPSLSDDAPNFAAYLPIGHFWLLQLMLACPIDYCPSGHIIHPSVSLVAPSFDAYYPAGQTKSIHDDQFVPIEY